MALKNSADGSASRLLAFIAVTRTVSFVKRKKTGTGTFGTLTSYTSPASFLGSRLSLPFISPRKLFRSASGIISTTGESMTFGVTVAVRPHGRFESMPSRPLSSSIWDLMNSTPCLTASPWFRDSPRNLAATSRSATDAARTSIAGPSSASLA